MNTAIAFCHELMIECRSPLASVTFTMSCWRFCLSHLHLVPSLPPYLVTTQHGRIMTDSTAGKKNGEGMRIAEDHDYVSSWLQGAVCQEYDDFVNELGDSASIEPTTPPRRRFLAQRYEEVSPTNTSFSDDSVFDVPHLPDESVNGDPFCDDIPDIFPADNLNWVSKSNARQRSARSSLEDHQDTPDDDESLVSYDPPSEAAVNIEDHFHTPGEALASATPSLINPSIPLFTEITSCTQCIVADLPCSRTVPCCSRCKRNGEGDVCLLHRQLYGYEIDRSETSMCTQPVLLKLQGEDKMRWRKKLRRMKEVLSTCSANVNYTDHPTA